MLDILAGCVVHAVRGQRSTYRPIVSTLCATSEPVAVAQALARHCAARVVYVADLDALLGNAPQYRPLAAIAAALPDVELWLDAGWRDGDEAERFARALPGVRLTPVFGTESLRSIEDACRALAMRDRAILSLDRKGGTAIDPAGCWDAPALWPARVIAMTLDRVGADEGPDVASFATIRARAPAPTQVIGAGGIRGPEDLAAVRDVGASAWLVASALHAGRIPAVARRERA